MHLYRAVPQLLENAGLRLVFGLFGSANVGWVAQGVASGQIDWVGVRHEGTAVSAAAAFNRTSGKVGVVSTTLGPGFANTLNSLAAALHDHTPMIYFVGKSPSGKAGGDFQRLNQRDLARAIGVGFHEVEQPEDLDTVFWAAHRDTLFAGVPQVISIDEKFLEAEVSVGPRPSTGESDLVSDEVDRDAAAAVARMLAAARRPLILAGRGAELSGCRDDLVELADLCGGVLGNTLAVNRFFRGHPRDLGVCGVSSSPAALQVLEEVDALFAVGATLNWFTMGENTLYQRARIAQCEISVDADVKASDPELALLGDAKACVRAVIEAWHAAGLSPSAEDVHVPSWQEMRASMLQADLGHDPSRGLDLRTVYADLDDRLPENRLIITDGGRSGIPIPAMLDARDNRRWLTSRGYGSIGLAIPAAIGAALGDRDARVVVLCGDGGFMMSAQELDTIRFQGLDVTIVVMNDQQLGSELKYLRRFGLDYTVAEQSTPDLVQLARAYGGEGFVVQTEDELAELDYSQGGLRIIDVRIDPVVDPANL